MRASPIAFKVALITVGLALVLFVGIRIARIAGTKVCLPPHDPDRGERT